MLPAAGGRGGELGRGVRQLSRAGHAARGVPRDGGAVGGVHAQAGVLGADGGGYHDGRRGEAGRD